VTTTRAVLRPIEPGNDAVCAHCGSPVRFAARSHAQQVIANVYVDGAWHRVEHFHARCYPEAGSPYGEVAPPAPPTPQGGVGGGPEEPTN
jgi:hypothetical protein